MVERLALSPHQVRRFESVCSPTMSVWDFSNFLPQSKDMQIVVRLIGDSKLIVWVWIGVNLYTIYITTLQMLYSNVWWTHVVTSPIILLVYVIFVFLGCLRTQTHLWPVYCYKTTSYYLKTFYEIPFGNCHKYRLTSYLVKTRSY